MPGASRAVRHIRVTHPRHDFATLEIDGTAGGDSTRPFDPVRNALPGLETYDWVAQLREPSYAASRRARRARSPDTFQPR